MIQQLENQMLELADEEFIFDYFVNNVVQIQFQQKYLDFLNNFISKKWETLDPEIANIPLWKNLKLKQRSRLEDEFYYQHVSKKSWILALILHLPGFILVGGLHCFYLGKTVEGVLKLFTGNYFWLGNILDFKSMLQGYFIDKENKLVLR